MEENNNLEQEEVIEELNENNDITEESKEEVLSDIPTVLENNDSSVSNQEINSDNNTNENMVSDNSVNENIVNEKDTDKLDSTISYETVNESLNEKKKSKAPLIILLSILLFIDIVALIIYIIGVDKIISFIK